jgi:hypothetical protein
LSAAFLNGAYLEGTDLGGAHLNGSNVTGAVYEPVEQPLLGEIAHATGLEKMTYRANPTALTELRKQFREHGFTAQEAMITYALETTKADALLGTTVQERIALRTTYIGSWEKMKLRLRLIAAGCTENPANCAAYLLKTVALNWTCRYGLSPGRPLAIVVGVWLIFSAVYVLFLRCEGKSGVYLVVPRRKGKGEIKRRIRCEVHGKESSGVTLKGLLCWPNRILLLVRVGMLFSMINIMNIDVELLRKFNPWSLVKLVMPRDFDLQGKGWVKTMAGIQTILSLFLIGLWTLLMMHSPFE